jgi:prespore-specific regulator
MVASRQDAWTEDDDLVLAEVTLRHIREGGTQLAAFEEVGQRLGRTPAACGFRWNSTVRKQYEAAIAIAKAQRQQMKKMGRQAASANRSRAEGGSSKLARAKASAATATAVLEAADDELQLERVIRFLTQQKETARRLKQLERELEQRDQELKELREENTKLKKELESVQGVNDDYRALVQIMERARKLAFLQEEETKPVFKMDANGNLERIE